MNRNFKLTILVFFVLVLISVVLTGCQAEDNSGMSKKLKSTQSNEWVNASKMEYLPKPEPLYPKSEEKQKSYVSTEEEQKKYSEILTLINEGKDFEKELRIFEKKYKDSPNVENIYYELVVYHYYNKRGKKNQKLEEVCKLYAEKFPDGVYFNSVMNYYNWARGVTLEIYTQASFLPGDDANVFLSIRKLNEVELNYRTFS